MKKKLLLFIFFPVFYFSQYSIPAAERSALIDLYNTSGGPNWSAQWDFTQDPQKWYGIKIQGGHVTEIGLAGNLLSGNLSSSITTLTALKKLDVSSNRLTGSNLQFLAGLNNLEVLNLNFNGFDGDASQQFGSLTQLKELSVSYNKFSISSLGNLISSFKNLQRLEIAKTGITALPNSISSASKLRILDISDNTITDLSSLASLSNLEELKISNLNLTKFPTPVSNLINLYLLDISNNPMTDFTGLDRLKKLQWLSLKANNITAIPQEVNSLDNLLTLNLSDNKLSSGIGQITNLPTLQQLWLSNNKFEKAFPAEILNFKSLLLVDISGNQLTGALPTNLPAFSDVSNNKFSADNIVSFVNANKSASQLLYSPQRYDDPTDIAAPIGNSTKLTQSLPADGTYQFTWYKNLSDNTHVTTDNYNIGSVTKNDYTSYTCEAYFEAQTKYEDVLLSLFREPITLSEGLGTKENNLQDINIFPNPTTDYLNITTKGQKVIKLSLYDMTGKIVLAKDLEEKIDIRNLPTGVYILKVETSGQTKQFKVLKK